MKKRYCVLAACALLLTGCGGNSGAAASSAASSEAASAASSVPASGEIPFQQVDAVYHDPEIENSPELRQKTEQLQSRVILSAEQLNANLNQPAKTYTEQFFADHALIYVGVEYANTASAPPTVTKLTRSGNTVTVHAARKDAMMEAKQWWCTFFEVSKSALAGIDEYAAFDYDLTADNMGNIDTDVILRHAGK